MPTSVVSYEDRSFTPAEAEAITDVSGSLQRQWDKRGLLARDAETAGKWRRFSLDDIVKMMLMKRLSDSGFSVKAVMSMAAMVALPVRDILYELPGAVVSNAGRPPSAEGIQPPSYLTSSYLIVTRKDRDAEPLLARGSSLDNLSELLARRGAIHCIIVDLVEMAKTISQRVEGPLVVINEVVKFDEEQS